ncbi:MAG: MFS transporter [Peptococcales bacterium]|jgi:MFS family permease
MINSKPSNNFTYTLIATTLFISTYYMLLPVLPLHMQLMGGSKFKIGLIMGLFSTSSLFFRALAGQAADRKGPIKMMKLGVSLYFVSPLFYLIDSFLLIGLVQLIYGFTIGAFTIASASVITVCVPREKISQAIGLHSIALICAKGFAPTLGIYIYNALGLVTLIAVTLIFSIFAYFLTKQIGNIPPTNNGKNISFAKVISNKLVWIPSVVLMTVTLTFGALMTMLPLFALERDIEHYSLFFTVNTIAVVATRLFTGKQKNFFEEGLIAMSMVFIFIAVFLVAGSFSLPMLILAAFIYGLGYGAVYPALSSLVVLNTPSEIRGSAFGLYTAAFDVGVTLGSVWGGLSEYLGFKFIYLSSSIVPLIGLSVFLFFLHEEKKLSALLIRKAK